MDDPHDPFNGYRPDMGQEPQDDREDGWPPGWWILPSIGGGVVIWIVLFILVL